jgi:biotin transport system substrate-specific component
MSNTNAKQIHTGMRAIDLAYCGMFVALMVIGAKINIVLPIGTGVTVSLQILFAVMAGLLLGARDGFISVFIYLLIGLLGLPVYAHGGGLWYVLKPTYGFIIGFVSAAFLSGLLKQALKKRTLVRFLIAGEIGMLSYYVWGLFYFFLMSNFLLKDAQPIGFKELMTVWFLSTVWIDAIIAGLASVIAYRLAPIVDRFRENYR